MLLARLQLTQALQRAQYAIAWERAWPASGPAFERRRTVSGGVLGRPVAGAAVRRHAPSASRCSLCRRWRRWFRSLRFRWPTREEGLSRLDRGTGIRHRPATALTDTLASKDPIAQALWREQRERTLASIKRIRAGLPSPRPRHPRSLGAAGAGHR